MIPLNWKKEFEAQFRMPGVTRTYEALVGQLLAIGNEERYMANRRGPNDMDTDNLEKQAQAPNNANKQGDEYWADENQEYTEQEKIEWAEYIGQQLDWLGQKGKGGGKGSKGKGKGGKGKGGMQGKGGGTANAQNDASHIMCPWCYKYGHYRKDCQDLAKYKQEKDAERAKKGDHTPKRGNAPLRPAGSLDIAYGDFEEVIGLTGDDEDADALDENTLGNFNDFADFEIDDDDEDDEYRDWEPDDICQNCDIEDNEDSIESNKSCPCCPTTSQAEEERIITPDRPTSRVDKSTPIADLFSQAREMSPLVTIPAMKGILLDTGGQGFYQHKWEVLSISSKGGDIKEVENSVITGSATGLALRTDESAKSRSHKHDAEWQGQLTKPTVRRGWPSRRRTKRVRDQGVQTDITLEDFKDPRLPGIGNIETEEEVISCSDSGEEPVKPDKELGAEEEESGEAVSCDESESDYGEKNMDDDETNVELTPGERDARRMQNETADGDGFYDCNPEDVELSPSEIRKRRYRLKRGITADSGAGDPVIPRRMINSKKIRPFAGSKRGSHYVSATDHRIPNVGEIDLEFKTEEGYDESITFQVADVNKPLMSISDRVDKICRVVFDRDDTTGEDLTHIYNKKTKKRMKMKRIGKVWILDCTVTKEFISENNQVFNRQGK